MRRVKIKYSKYTYEEISFWEKLKKIIVKIIKM